MELSQEDSSGRVSTSVYGIQISTAADEHGASGDDDADAGAHAGPEPGLSPDSGTQQWTREDPGVHEGQKENAATGRRVTAPAGCL